MAKRYWLFKSEPNVFSYDDLVKSPKKTTYWDGVRNYQARNLLRDEIKEGDEVLYYHSRIEPMCIAGTATVVRSGYPDPTQFDKKSKYFDAKASPENPRWFVVDIQAKHKFSTPLTRDALKEMPELDGMMLLQKGSRLSVQPVESHEWKAILKQVG